MSIVERYLGRIESIPSPSLKIIAEAFSYIYSYFQEVNKKVILNKLEELEQKCEQEGLERLRIEIRFYQDIVRREGITRLHKERFQQAVYQDLFASYSEERLKNELN
ncbi:MAG: hypothetical protein ACTSP3_00635 [Candidatus Heimdallarchaeaceae archaeon]